MKAHSAQEIRFSEWVPWAERSSLRRPDGPWLGLYLWGHFGERPPKSRIPYPDLPEEMIYVGETKHLDFRPLSGKHHRLIHYCDTFEDDPTFTRLFLSIYRIHHFKGGYQTQEAQALYPRLRVYTQYLEARLYWEYTERWQQVPKLHYKKGRVAIEDQ
jgi:hypothetical protein